MRRKSTVKFCERTSFIDLEKPKRYRQSKHSKGICKTALVYRQWETKTERMDCL